MKKAVRSRPRWGGREKSCSLVIPFRISLEEFVFEMEPPLAHAALLGFCNTKEATFLRAVSRELRDPVAAFPWNDKSTRILSHIWPHMEQWWKCFPNAHTAMVSRAVLTEALFARNLP
jgi:hypothetical protein